MSRNRNRAPSTLVCNCQQNITGFIHIAPVLYRYFPVCYDVRTRTHISITAPRILARDLSAINVEKKKPYQV